MQTEETEPPDGDYFSQGSTSVGLPYSRSLPVPQLRKAFALTMLRKTLSIKSARPTFHVQDD
jgi:hypothetical protein